MTGVNSGDENVKGVALLDTKKAEHSCGRCCYRPSVLGTGMSQREGESGVRGNSNAAPAGTVTW